MTTFATLRATALFAQPDLPLDHSTTVAAW
jgi:hypothetical protein